MSADLATVAIALQSAHDGKSCAVCVYVDRNLARGMTCVFYDSAPTNAGNWCGVGLVSRKKEDAPVAERQGDLFDG